ncbi:hypothetical protein GTA07_10525 [Rhodococcus hoagii]|nr:hypothetical protein [Prescottella equi]
MTIAPKTNIGVTLVNNALLGKATITKAVVGDGLGGLTGNESFVIDAHIADDDDTTGDEVRQFTLRNGQHFELADLPIGAKVTFSEGTAAEHRSGDVVGTGDRAEDAHHRHRCPANRVSVTNEAKVTMGTFAVSKKLTGPEAFDKSVPKTFDVIASWNVDGAPQSKTLTLPADGTAVPFGVNLPGGTEVTLTETVPANGNGLAWGVPSYSGNVTIGDDGSAAVTIGKDAGKVEVTNYVDKNDGTLRIAKQVGGEAAEAVGDDAEFTVQARWNDGTEYVPRT